MADEPQGILFKDGVRVLVSKDRENDPRFVSTRSVPVQDIATGAWFHAVEVFSTDTRVDNDDKPTNRAFDYRPIGVIGRRHFVKVQTPQVTIEFEPQRVVYSQPAKESLGDDREIEADTLRAIIQQLEGEIDQLRIEHRDDQTQRRQFATQVEVQKKHIASLQEEVEERDRRLEEAEHTESRFAAFERAVLRVSKRLERSAELEAVHMGALSIGGMEMRHEANILRRLVEEASTVAEYDHDGLDPYDGVD